MRNNLLTSMIALRRWRQAITHGPPASRRGGRHSLCYSSPLRSCCGNANRQKQCSFSNVSSNKQPSRLAADPGAYPALPCDAGLLGKMLLIACFGNDWAEHCKLGRSAILGRSSSLCVCSCTHLISAVRRERRPAGILGL